MPQRIRVGCFSTRSIQGIHDAPAASSGFEPGAQCRQGLLAQALELRAQVRELLAGDVQAVPLGGCRRETGVPVARGHLLRPFRHRGRARFVPASPDRIADEPQSKSVERGAQGRQLGHDLGVGRGGLQHRRLHPAEGGLGATEILRCAAHLSDELGGVALECGDGHEVGIVERGTRHRSDEEGLGRAQ